MRTVISLKITSNALEKGVTLIKQSCKNKKSAELVRDEYSKILGKE